MSRPRKIKSWFQPVSDCRIFQHVHFFVCVEDPAEQVFDDNMGNVNNYLQNIAKFEQQTNS